MSAKARTGVCCDSSGQHTSLSNKGEYSFSKFTLESYAEVIFEKDPVTLKGIQFAILELHYGAILFGESLDITANEITLHPGSTLKLEGGGFGPELGPGAGSLVSWFKQLTSCICVSYLSCRNGFRYMIVNKV